MHGANRITIGWREWLTLPDLGIVAIRAKIDTGARSSSLHVEQLEEFRRDGAVWLRFQVAAGGRGSLDTIVCEAVAADRRPVTDSGGAVSERWFVRTQIALAGQRWPIEINLTNRRNMLFPMLLGRSAMSGRFVVDPQRSFVYGRRKRRRAQKD
jgi:hypothetical protein